jgi:hypothetical protein
MLKTAKGRYDETLAYIRQVSQELATDADRVIGTRARGAGGEISISGAGHKKPGTLDDRKAIRALMLLQITYFRIPYAPQDYASAWVLGQTLTNALTRTKQDIDAEILEYLPTGTGTVDGVADAAERINSTTGVFDPVNYRRTDTNLSSNPVCYHGVGTWLFGAGLVSKRWLARGWNGITANTCNIILGDGVVVDRRNWGLIPAGWVWNIHRVGDKTTCHWGISVGNDIAIACNNTDESPTRRLAYIRGNTKYGKFIFSELCEVLNGTAKYGHLGTDAPTQDNIVVRQFDPADPPTPYY